MIGFVHGPWQETGYDAVTQGILRKAQEIILARSDVEVSLRAKRLFNLLLYKAMSTGRARAEQGGMHRISVADMLEYVGGQQSWDRVDEALKTLAMSTLTLDYVDENGMRNTSAVHYLSYHMTHSDDGWVTFAFDPLLLRFVYDPKVYALMSLSDMRSFRTISGSMLYERLSLTVRRQFSTEWDVTVAEFRQYMCMCIPNGRYSRFDNLRARVIEPAVDEINELAPFRVDVEYRRGGRGGNVKSMVFRPVLKGASMLSGRDAALGKVLGKVSGKALLVPLDGRGDMLGYSDGERYGGLTDEALETASMLLDGGDPLAMASEWQRAMQGRTVLRPDKSFLSWLEARLGTRPGGVLADMDMEGVDNLIGAWIEGTDK